MTRARVALSVMLALASACESPTPPEPEARAESCAGTEDQLREQLTLLHELVETERQLQAITDELRRAKDESFFAALERQQGVLHRSHEALITKLDQLVQPSSLPPECPSVQACFGLEAAKLAL